jgi:hypothetical protein
MEAAGIELPLQNTGETNLSHQSGAECGALGADSGHVTGDLMLVVKAWPKLTDAMRENILAMIQNTD